MELTYALTKHDIATYYDTLTVYGRRVRSKKPEKLTPQARWRWIQWAFTGILLPALAAFVLMSILGLRLNQGRGQAIFYGFFLSWLLLNIATARPRYVWNVTGGKGMLDKRTVRLEPRGLFVGNERAEGVSYWRTVKEIKEDAQGVWFFYDPRQAAVFVPNHAFGNDVEKTAFFEQAQALHQSAKKTDMDIV